jgi:hypothetical protein
VNTSPPPPPVRGAYRPAMSDMEVRATSLHAALEHLGHGAHLEQVARTADQFGRYIRTGRMFDSSEG